MWGIGRNHKPRGQSTDAELSHLRADRDAAIQAAQAAVRDVTRLTRLLTVLNEPAPLPELLDKALSSVSELFSADIVTLLDPSANMAPIATIGIPEDMLHLVGPGMASEELYAGLQTGWPILIDQVGADSSLGSIFEELGAETVVIAPVMENGETRGALLLARCQRAPFSESEAALLKTMAYRIALTQEQALRSDQLEQLVRNSREMGGGLDEPTVCNDAVRMFTRVVRADGAALVLTGADGPRCAAYTGLAPSSVSLWLRLTATLSDVNSVDALPFVTHDFRGTLERFSLEVPKDCPVNSVLALPFQFEESIGLLFAMRFAPTPFNFDNVQIATLFVGQVTAALENANLYRALKEELAARKRAEEERLQFQLRLQNLKKAESLARMAGAIAHNFNNMLYGVMGNLEMALDDIPKGSELEVYLNQAMQSANGAAQTSRCMLTYLGQTTGRKEIIDAAAAMREECKLLNASLPANVRLTSEVPSSSLLIRLDMAHLRQILSILTINAIESVGKAAGEIRLSIQTVRAESLVNQNIFPLEFEPWAEKYVVIAVSDNGCGIDKETIPMIFDPFFSTKFSGRGLGLPMALGLARAFDGAISVESEPGKGATFRVLAPLTEIKFPTRDAKPTPKHIPIAAHDVVLVVDDDKIVQMVAEHMLDVLLGCRVILASSGEEAVEICRAVKEEISLVLLDIAMPGMDGWQTLTAIRALRPDIPVIFATGYDPEEVYQNTQPQQPQVVLHKPYLKDDLLAALSAALPQ